MAILASHKYANSRGGQTINQLETPLVDANCQLKGCGTVQRILSPHPSHFCLPPMRDNKKMSLDTYMEDKRPGSWTHHMGVDIYIYIILLLTYTNPLAKYTIMFVNNYRKLLNLCVCVCVCV